MSYIFRKIRERRARRFKIKVINRMANEMLTEAVYEEILLVLGLTATGREARR